MIMKILLELIIFVSCFQFYFCQSCPYFQYVESNGRTVGKIEFQNDLSGSYRININMTVAAFFNNNEKIQLQLMTGTDEIINGYPLVYLVHFPFQDVLPRPTRIEFNRQVYCTGPPEQVRPGKGVTNFWADHNFEQRYVNSQSRPHQQQPRPIVTNTIDTRPHTTTTPLQVFTIPTYAKNPFLQTLSTRPPYVTERGTERPVVTQRITERTIIQRITERPTERPVVTHRPIFTQPVTQIIQQQGPGGVTQKITVTNSSQLECGFVSSAGQQLIANGDEVTEGQFPWMAAIMYKITKNTQYKYKCTGSLVSNQHVVTAAHCIQYEKAFLFPFEDLLVVFAKVDIEDWNIGSLTSGVRNVNVHPDYTNSGDADIAVFTLTNIIRFQVHIKPICLWQGDDDLDKIVGTQGTVAGWGSDETGKAVVAEARHIRLPIVSQAQCLLSNSRFITLTSNRTFCAGNRNGAGPCNGDSGAGYIIKINERWTLRGVVSRALNDVNTCDLNNYFVFADVAKVSRWLRAAMA